MADSNPREIRTFWEQVAERELGETPEVKKNCLANLRRLLSEDSQLRCPTDDAFLLKFLRCRKYQVEPTLKIIRAYFRARMDYPEMLKGLRPDSCNFDLLVRQHRLLIILKEKDSLGRGICLVRIGAWNTRICSLMELMRATITLYEHALLDDQNQVVGGVAVVDFSGFDISHFCHLVPFLRRIVHLAQDCFPVRIKGIYAINCPSFFGVVLAFVKPFLKLKILNRIHILRDDFKTLHDAIPPELLPPEFGGTRQVFDFDSMETSLRSKQRYFEEMEQFGYST